MYISTNLNYSERLCRFSFQKDIDLNILEANISNAFNLAYDNRLLNAKNIRDWILEEILCFIKNRYDAADINFYIDKVRFLLNGRTHYSVLSRTKSIFFLDDSEWLRNYNRTLSQIVSATRRYLKRRRLFLFTAISTYISMKLIIEVINDFATAADKLLLRNKVSVDIISLIFLV